MAADEIEEGINLMSCPFNEKVNRMSFECKYRKLSDLNENPFKDLKLLYLRIKSHIVFARYEDPSSGEILQFQLPSERVTVIL